MDITEMPRKRARTPDPVSPSFSPDQALGKTFCTPHGLSIGSLAIYNSYEAMRNFGEGRYRPLVHTKGTEWWLSRDNLKGCEGWIFTDAPPRPWKYTNTLRPYAEPEILPILHRRGFVNNLEPLFHCFMQDASIDQVRYDTAHKAESLFHLKICNQAWLHKFNNVPWDKLQKEITMCHLKNTVEECNGCKREHLIVAKIGKIQLCNMCCKRYHALIKFFQVIPSDIDIRNLPESRATLVDRCLTIEENMRTLPTTVLDYSNE